MSPLSPPDVIFLVLGCSGIFSLILAWVRFAGMSPSFTSKQGVCTLIGLLANSTVVVFPVIYIGRYPFSPGFLIVGLLAFSTLSIVVSFFGLKEVRPMLMIGAASIVVLLLMIPISIL